MDHIGLIAGAGLLAGVMNALAGGGSFVSLPALMAAGTPALSANASSTVALIPSALASAYAYRADFRAFEGASMRAMAIVSILGGAAGAVLLMATPPHVFDMLTPWLLLFGVVTFAFGRQAGAKLRQYIHIKPRALLVCQFFLGVYGGYFGGAVGIMMLAAWSLLTTVNVTQMQASRNLLNVAMNVTAAFLFILNGMVYWPQTLTLMGGAAIGGYGAARLGRKIDPAKARLVITCINATIAALVFWRVYG